MGLSEKIAGTSVSLDLLPIANAVRQKKQSTSRPGFRYLLATVTAVATWILYRNFIHSFLSIKQDLSGWKYEFEENWASLLVGTVKWGSCRNATPGLERIECGFVIVPLDYFNSSAGVARVALSRLQATKYPRKGSVLFNPGGPGNSGVDLVAKTGPSLQFITGEDYDVVGFDPRGIGKTLPSVKCFVGNEYDLFKVNTILDRGFDVASNLSDSKTRDHLLIQQREAESLYQLEFEMCRRTMGDTLRYMGTSTVAGDIDFITKALDGEEATMFPDRVGRIVIDGVADVAAWVANPSYTWYRNWLALTETTYDLFLSECSKVGPSICPLAEFQNEDPSGIDERIEDFFKKLYHHPLAIPDATRPGILTQGRARGPLFRWLQTPLAWREASEILSEAMKGNASALLSRTQAISMDLPRAAVSCNDNIPRKPAPTPEEIVDESLYNLEHVTRFGLTIVTTEPDAGCQYWPVTPPERFNGPWNHTLSYPILIHSNLVDPVTPMSSGKATKERLGDSARLVLREGPGHCSISLPSLCVAKINQRYFGNGTLPDDNHLCDVDVPLFPDSNIQDLSSLSREDRALMEHLYTLSDYFNYPENRYNLVF